MLITIRVPDNTTRIMYTETDRDGYETEPKNVNMGMFVRVEKEDEPKEE